MPKKLKDETSEAMDIRLGDDVTLACPFENVDHFEWLKDGELLNNQTYNLTFVNVSAAYGGNHFNKSRMIHIALEMFSNAEN